MEARFALTGFFELQGAGVRVWGDSNPPLRGWVYRLAPGAPFFLGPEAFLEPLRASRLRPCARTHLKKVMCHTRPVSGTFDKYRAISARTVIPVVEGLYCFFFYSLSLTTFWVCTRWLLFFCGSILSYCHHFFVWHLDASCTSLSHTRSSC